MNKSGLNLRALRMMLAVVLVVGLAISACTPAGGEEADAGIPEIAVGMTENGLTVPSEVPSGVVAFKMVGEADAIPARLNEGVTVDQVNEALMQPDPLAALALVTLLGGGSNTTDDKLTLDLQQGQHIIVNFPENAPPSVVPFMAGEPSGATAPTADVTIDMVDFNFVVPSEIESGPKVWQINNKGTQWHEMAVVKLDEGVTVNDLVDMLMLEGASEEPPSFEGAPFEEVAFWAPNGPGETGWVTWDLPPGEYTVICFLPDVNGDMTPHVAHGMVGQLTVTE
ncbi:MAG: hypothetical protein R6X18_09130 [Chloroflexota bacterium]|jgi:hypothetical protein